MSLPSPSESATSPAKTVKLKLTIAYEGTRYRGWQRQRNAITVQQRVEESLQKIFPTAQKVRGASRTDAGVHAVGMAAHVEIPEEEFRMTAGKVLLAINRFLPEDIRIVDACRVSREFHAQFDCQRKQYRYQIWNHRAANPLLRSTAWHVPVKLNLELMRKAAQHFVGRRDFRSLAARRNDEPEDTVRQLFRCRVCVSGPLLTIIMEGDGFLYKMCRAIAGTLRQVGQGGKTPDDIPKMLGQKARRYAGMTAPAHGLILYRVFYSLPKLRNNRQ